MFGGIRPYTPIEKKVDAGTFAITVAGRRAGREAFEIVQVGLSVEVRTRATLALPAGQTTIRGTLRADPDWKPRSGTFDTITRGRTTRVTLQQRGNAVESTMTELPRRATASFTRPSAQPDLYLGSNMIAHLTPLCRDVDAKEKTLTVFPAAPLKIASSSLRRYPLTNLGAPGLELTEVVADLAQSVRISVLCDGTKLLAAHLSNSRLTAVRASFEELASVLEGRRRGKPIVSSTLAELARKVRVGSGEATLGCTLLLPRTHAEVKSGRLGAAASRAGARPDASGAHTYEAPPPPPLPAALLLGGFGPQDRDGNSVGPGDYQLYFLAVLASRLGEAGIATLRCDDRGTGESAGKSKAVTLETEARDALAALAALRAEPAVDPARVAVIGHGEGAIIAPMVAAKARAARGLALLAPPGRPLDAIIIDQQQWSMRRFGFSQAEIQASVAELSAVYTAVRAGKGLPDSLSPAERRGITESASWLRSHFRHAPMAEASALAQIPVFVAGGGRDVQISVADVDQTRDAFTSAGNKLVAYKVYPELNHLFTVSKNSGIGDYYDPMAEVDAAFLDDVVRFALTATAATPVTAASAPAVHAGRRPAR
jgi:alpha-beta hydrolase superfamily lysophospholipase